MHPFSKLNLFLLLIIFLGNYNSEAYENRSTGPRSVGMAGTGVAVSGPESIFLNQGAMALISEISIVSVYESRFFLKEYSYMSVGIAVPGSFGAIGLSYSQFGREIFKESKAGIAYSRSFGDIFAAGLQFSYISSVIPENRDPFYAVTVEGGVLIKISDKLHGAIHWFNPFGSSLNTPLGKQPIPRVFRIGEAWQVSSRLLWCVDIEKQENSDWLLRTGIEYYPADTFSLRAGFAGNPFHPTAGAGFNFGKFNFDIGFSYHGNLGFSPTAGLSIKL